MATEKKTPEAPKEPVVQDAPKEVMQSYILTTARRDWGIYAERFLLRLVELAQSDIKGMDFRNSKDMCPHKPSLIYPNVEINGVGDAIVTIPIIDLISTDKDRYTNYQYIRDAVKQLQTSVIQWEEPKVDSQGNIVYKDGKPVQRWISVQVVSRATGEDDMDGSIKVRVDSAIWAAMIDFTKGFRVVDLSIAWKLKSKYAFRLYMLMSRQEKPITYSIEDLKAQWGITESYKRPDDFIRKTIEPAKQELDEIAPFSFDYHLERSDKPGRGQKPVEKITFFPKRLLKNDKPYNYRGVDKIGMLRQDVVNILKEKYSFAEYELNSNMDLLFEAQNRMKGSDTEHPTLAKFLVELSYNVAKAANPKGYIIASIKKHLREKYNYIYRSTKGKQAEEKIGQAAQRKPTDNKKDDIPSLGDLFSENKL